MSRRHHQRGFTLLELMVVVAIIGILAAAAAPSWNNMRDNMRLQEAARSISNAFTMARARAISTGNNHIVYFGGASFGGGPALGPLQDRCGNQLQDVTGGGTPVPILVLDDGPPGPGTNCCIDGNDVIITEYATPNAFWGVANAAAAAPDDNGTVANMTVGSTFTDPAGFQTRWVMFRPDGIPVGFSALCVTGNIGTGAGAMYLTNGNRDYGVVLTPLGGVKLHSFDQSTGIWTN